MRNFIASDIRAARVVLVRATVAAAIVLFAAPLAAQELSSDVVRSEPARVTTRQVASFRLLGAQVKGIPAEVTIADRGGQLVASYRLPGQHDAQPMMVTVLDTDIILQAETDKGVLTLQLYDRNDAPAGRRSSVGRWTLGSDSGELRAK